MPDIDLISGPLEGVKRTTANALAYVWIDAETFRVFKERGPNRLLYKQVGMTINGERRAYMWAGLTHAQCKGCGAYSDLTAKKPTDSTTKCSLCAGLLDRVSG